MLKHFAYVDAENRVRFVCSTTDALPPFSHEHWTVEINPGQVDEINSAEAVRDREVFLEEGLIRVSPKSISLSKRKAAKIAELERKVENFIARRPDGRLRYPAARQVALHSILQACRYRVDTDLALSGEQKRALRENIDSIMKAFAWIGRVHADFRGLKERIESAATETSLDAIELDAASFDSTDPEIKPEMIAWAE